MDEREWWWDDLSLLHVAADYLREHHQHDPAANTYITHYSIETDRALRTHWPHYKHNSNDNWPRFTGQAVRLLRDLGIHLHLMEAGRIPSAGCTYIDPLEQQP